MLYPWPWNEVAGHLAQFTFRGLVDSIVFGTIYVTPWALYWRFVNRP